MWSSSNQENIMSVCQKVMQTSLNYYSRTAEWNCQSVVGRYVDESVRFVYMNVYGKKWTEVMNSEEMLWFSYGTIKVNCGLT